MESRPCACVDVLHGIAQFVQLCWGWQHRQVAAIIGGSAQFGSMSIRYLPDHLFHRQGSRCAVEGQVMRKVGQLAEVLRNHNHGDKVSYGLQGKVPVARLPAAVWFDCARADAATSPAVASEGCVPGSDPALWPV